MNVTTVPPKLRKLHGDYKRAVADIRKALKAEHERQLSDPCIHERRSEYDPEYRPLVTVNVTPQDIIDLSELIVAISCTDMAVCTAPDWALHLRKKFDRPRIWELIDILQGLGFVSCSQWDDPYFDGEVSVAESVRGRYISQ